MAPHEDRHWRVHGVTHFGAAAVSLMTILYAVAATLQPPADPPVVPILWAVTTLAVTWTWQYAFVPYVAVTGPAVVLRNPLSCRAVPYGEIVSVAPTRQGLRIRLRNGSAQTAVAVQKATGDSLRGRPTRADALAGLIRSKIPIAAS